MDRVTAQIRVDALNVEGLNSKWCPVNTTMCQSNCICYIPAYIEATSDATEWNIRSPRCNNKSLMGDEGKC